MKLTLALAVLFLTVAPAAFAASKDSVEADKQALLKAEADFEKAREQKGLEGWLSFFADDTLDLPAGLPIASGKDVMRKRLQTHWDNNVHLKWQPVKVDVARSGDLGYTAGNWQIPVLDKRINKRVVITGKYLTVWKKQKDGSWKVVADLGNQDPVPTQSPAPAATPAKP
jgi:ketosteroid isomerase-like protein